MAKLLRLSIIAFVLMMFFEANIPSLAQIQAQGMAISHAEDIPVASPIVAVDPKVPVTGENISYGNLNNQELVGYLATPTNTTGPLPALIVIHEWWGLNDNIKIMTERLAGEGYTALAVDLYEGKVAEDRQTARELVTVALENQARLQNNLRQAYQYLQQEEQAPKIASIGWCFGGTWSLNTALLFPDSLDAAVIYYGGGIETDPNKLKPLEMPILGIFGALDNNPSPATVAEFESALKDLNKNVEIYIYENADHAFANPSGTRYNREAAEDAWSKTTAFLEKYLQ